MKAAPFEYRRAATVDEACELLASGGARIIAGGQTLIPMMAMRLARPAWLVDIARIPELSFVREANGNVVIGATTRQAAALQDPLIRDRMPLLAAALPHVGHPPTRARGTIGGSLAHADPSAEIALVAITLGATLVYRDGEETGEFDASEYFLGPMITALPGTACLTEVRFPAWSGSRVGVGFHEVSIRRSDFALVAAAAQLELDQDGACRRLALGLGGVGDTPIGLPEAAEELTGDSLDDAAVRGALTDALSDVEMVSDLHASADYRRRVGVELLARAISDARRAALENVAHAHPTHG